MSRPMGSKNRKDEEVTKEALTNELKKYLHDEDIDEKIVDEVIANNEKDENVSIFEAASRLNTSETTIKTWIDHGILRGSNGRVSVISIRECRFNARRFM